MSTLIQIPYSQISEVRLECVSNTVEDTNDEVNEVPALYSEDGEIETHFERSAWGTVSFVGEYEGQKLTLSFDWHADTNTTNYNDSYDYDITFGEEPNEEINFCFVDEDGDVVDVNLDEIDSECLDSWTCQIKHDLPKAEEFEELEDTEMSEITGEEAKERIIKRDNAPDLKFKGVLIASNSSRTYTNDHGRWFEIALYKTVGGKFVCQRKEYTQWQGENNRYFASVCDSVDCVKNFFGQGRYSKKLYKEAGIDNIEIVD